MRLEQRLGRAELQAGSIGLHLHGHELSVRRQIEQFFSVAPEAWPTSAIAGNLPLATSRKALDPHLIAARVIRLVGDPFAVGRKVTIPLIELRL